jgi:hypothetical protein
MTHFVDDLPVVLKAFAAMAGAFCSMPMADISSHAMRFASSAVLKVLKADPRNRLHALRPLSLSETQSG